MARSWSLLSILLWVATGSSLWAQMESEPPPLVTDPDLDAAPIAEAPVSTLAPAPTFEETLLELVNQVRASCSGYSCSASACPGGSKPPIKGEWRLREAAEFHSGNMGARNFHMHCDPDTLTSPGDRINQFGYSWSSYGENIAAGYSTPQNVMNAWMGSSGHCSNILGSRREIGPGYHYDGSDSGNVRQSVDGSCPATSSNNGPYQRYWTQVFSSRGTSYPLIIEGESFLTSTTSVDLYLYSPGGSSPQMRFSDDGETWSSFQPYSSSSVWVLPAGDGVKVLYSEFQSSAGTYRSCDRIWLDGSGSTSDVVFRDSFECGDDSLGLWDDVVLP